MIETERLLMRPFTPDDLEKLIELRSDDEVIKYLGGKALQNPTRLQLVCNFILIATKNTALECPR